jgi:hypothetical protein
LNKKNNAEKKNKKIARHLMGLIGQADEPNF